MSRIGNLPVPVPSNVRVGVSADNEVSVSGPLGSLTARFRPEVSIQLTNGQLRVQRAEETKLHRSLHGLTRALLNNMVQGVTQGYRKELEVVGTGYRVQQSGKTLTFQVGFSHPVEFQSPQGITLAAAGGNRVVVSGCDKQQVGQVAAQLRAIRPPDSYKGKGVRYAGEVLRLRPGKAAARAQ